MILEGTDDRTLRRAVGHIEGTSLPGENGNIAIAGTSGHVFPSAARYFGRDDEIILKTAIGAYHYDVDSTAVVAPEDTEVLDPSNQAILTLVTCYPFHFVGAAPKRFIVRAHRIDGDADHLSRLSGAATP